MGGRRRARAPARERRARASRRLEGLITAISTRFVTLEAEEIDAAIETSLGEVAAFACSERAGCSAARTTASRRWLRTNG
jgi:hypothetical protein